jgi:hypothetical protein
MKWNQKWYSALSRGVWLSIPFLLTVRCTCSREETKSNVGQTEVMSKEATDQGGDAKDQAKKLIQGKINEALTQGQASLDEALEKNRVQFELCRSAFQAWLGLSKESLQTGSETVAFDKFLKAIDSLDLTKLGLKSSDAATLKSCESGYKLPGGGFSHLWGE